MIHGRRLFLAGGGVALLSFVSGGARAEVSQPPLAQDGALDAVFAQGAPPALIGAAVTRDGIVWSGVQGVRRASEPALATLDDRWHLGSNTKAMTAALYARLVEKGQARWGATVPDLFPDLRIDPAWHDTTIEALMGHVAGLKDEAVIGLGWLLTARSDPAALAEQRTVIAARALAKPPSGAPGTFAYGNANYILVGAAIERITGVSWEEAMRAEVFEPLGLTSGGFGPPTGDQPWGHRTRGTAALPIDPADPGADNPLAMGPAGTVHMSLGDYATFIAAFLGKATTDGATERPWLSPETITRLTTPTIPEPRGYGHGWILLSGQPWAAGPVIAHEGSNTMWHAMVIADPTAGRAWIAMSNDETRGGPACQALVQRLIQAT